MKGDNFPYLETKVTLDKIIKAFKILRSTLPSDGQISMNMNSIQFYLCLLYQEINKGCSECKYWREHNGGGLAGEFREPETPQRGEDTWYSYLA